MSLLLRKEEVPRSSGHRFKNWSPNQRRSGLFGKTSIREVSWPPMGGDCSTEDPCGLASFPAQMLMQRAAFSNEVGLLRTNNHPET